MDNKVKFSTEDTNEEVEFTIVNRIGYKEEEYLLVVDTETNEEEQEAMILKLVKEENADVVFKIVEDDEELEELLEVFQENGDDFDIDILE